MKYYYDCRVVTAKLYRPRGIKGMRFSDPNLRLAIKRCKNLLKLARELKRKPLYACIRKRQRGKIGHIKTWHKLPIVWHCIQAKH